MKKISTMVLYATLLVVFSVLAIPFEARAELAPQIYVTDLKVNAINNNTITGEFQIQSIEKYYFTDLNYEVKLFSGADIHKSKLVDLFTDKQTFFTAPESKTTKQFSYQYPENIPSGDYTLWIQVMTQRGRELGWKYQTVSLEGSNKFLDIDASSPKVLVDGKEYFTLEGVNIDANQNATGYFKIVNPGEQITATPNVRIYNRQYNMSVYKEYQGSPITFANGETKEVKLQFPKISVPESYLAEVKFEDSNGQQVSGTQYFRWVVKGLSGKILYLKADKDYFAAGENINLTVECVGPSDASDAGQGILEASLSGKDNSVVAEVSTEVPLNRGTQILSVQIPVKSETVSPIIEVKLLKGEKILDQRTISLPVFSDQAKQIEKNIQTKALIIKCVVYASIAIVLLIIIAILVYILRFRKTNENI